VFPDEKGGRGLDYVFAAEEDADEAGCCESFYRTFSREFQGEISEAGKSLVLWQLRHVP